MAQLVPAVEVLSAERRAPSATPHWQRDTPNPGAVSGAGGCPQPPPPAPNRIPLESPS